MIVESFVGPGPALIYYVPAVTIAAWVGGLRSGLLAMVLASAWCAVFYFPPFGSVSADMSPKGYDVDMANLIGKAMGVKVELVPVTSANRIPYLQTKKVELLISSLGKNPDREKVIDFSNVYAPFFNGVFGPKDLAVAKV
ncbi:MAG: transporter substrate-binding domain-containing protein, partial [Verrucomicrobiales bacterium]